MQNDILREENIIDKRTGNIKDSVLNAMVDLGEKHGNIVKDKLIEDGINKDQWCRRAYDYNVGDIPLWTRDYEDQDQPCRLMACYNEGFTYAVFSFEDMEG